VNDVVIGDFDNNQRNDMLLLHGALRPSQVLSFNGNRIEAQFITRIADLPSSRAGCCRWQLDWSKTFVTTPCLHRCRGTHRPRSISRSIRTTRHARDKPRNPSANNGELHVGYDPATQTWTFMQYWATSTSTPIFEVQSSTTVSSLVPIGIQGADGPQQPVLLSNLPTGMTDRTVASGLGRRSLRERCGRDFDNDNGRGPVPDCRNGVENIADILLMNDGHEISPWSPTRAERPVRSAGGGRGRRTVETVVSADYDLDGRVDLLVTNGMNLRPQHRNNGPTSCSRTPARSGNWIERTWSANSNHRRHWRADLCDAGA